MGRETLERSLADGRGLEAARYVACLSAVAAPISIVHFTQPHPSKLLVIGTLIGGLLLAALLYGVVTRICIVRRLAKLRGIKGMDAAAVETQLDRPFRRATLTVRAKFVGDWSLASKRVRALAQIADARMEGDDLVVVTEWLRTRTETTGIGARTSFSNWPMYCAVVAITEALPPCERIKIEVAGDVASPDENAGSPLIRANKG